jgi:hypothetical protein
MTNLQPRAPIRRFDVFAEYNRIKNVTAGEEEAKAKGDAIWLAKVVAGRRFGRSAASDQQESRPRERHDERGADGFRSAGGVPQTDQTFDKEIVERMGVEFYRQGFQPAIEQAVRDGKKYEDIRDTIRGAWK